MGPKTRGVLQRSVSVGLEVAYKAFVGDNACFLECVHPLSYLDVDVVTPVSDGEEGLSKYHLVWDAFYMDTHVLKVGHCVVEVLVDDVCQHVAGPFAGVEYYGVEVDIEV